MSKTTSYEWDVETIDVNGDIADHNHADRLAECVEMLQTGDEYRLVLVRDVHCEFDGLIDRQWAYVENGELPERFADELGELLVKVPKRFHKEFVTWYPKMALGFARP